MSKLSECECVIMLIKVNLCERKCLVRAFLNCRAFVRFWICAVRVFHATDKAGA